MSVYYHLFQISISVFVVMTAVCPVNPVQVGESVFHTTRWVTPLSEELCNLSPREEFLNMRFGFLSYL